MTTANRQSETRAEWQPCKIDNRKALTNIDAIEQVVMLAEGSALCPTFFRVAKRPLEYLAKRLMLTKEQVALFSVFVNFSDRYTFTLTDKRCVVLIVHLYIDTSAAMSSFCCLFSKPDML